MDDVLQKTIAAYDLMADKYAKKTANIPPEEREEFIAFVKPGGKILDAGCGPGRDAVYFSEKGFQVVGVDLSEKLLELARKKSSKVEFYKQDLRSLTFPINSFDAIWACASLLHVRRDEASSVLSRFYSLLNFGGVLFILVKEGSGEADVADPFSSGLTRHFTYFTQVELGKMLQIAKFTILKIYTYSEKNRKKQGRDVRWIAAFCHKQ